MPIELPSTTRLEAFTDAVIAIALTIMVLELHPMDILNQRDMHGAGKVSGPKILVYALSFILIMRIWINHCWRAAISRNGP
jgi:uncharacterized membrane protein